MSYVYQSNLKQYIEGLLCQKHALGFPYRSSEDYLRQFDLMCLQTFPTETTLTKEMGECWGTIRSCEKRCSFQNRMAPIRELAKYMLRLGIAAYVINPIAVPKSSHRPIPHIFTDTELKKFFEASDRLKYNDRAKYRHLIVPVIFRLMYCCGLRPAEARLILRKNIDFREASIKIQESKGHKDRLVIMSDDVSRICEKYLLLIQDAFPGNDYLFPNWKIHEHFNHGWIDKMFWLCWNSAGLTDWSGERPCSYDFRHTFATKKLYEWMMQGKDLEAYLPYLSAYMGHAHFSHTAYYIHLVPEFFPHMSQMDLQRYETLLPEVDA